MNKVAVVQMCSSANIEQNIELSEKYLNEASKQGCKLIAFPENFIFFGAKDIDKLACAEELGSGPIQNHFANLAKDLNIYILGGSLAIKSTDLTRVFSTSILWSDQGEMLASYNKIHLFDVNLEAAKESYNESDTIVAGDTPGEYVGVIEVTVVEIP